MLQFPQKNFFLMTASNPQHPASVPLTYAACRPEYYVHSLLFFSPPRLDRRCCVSSATLSSPLLSQNLPLTFDKSKIYMHFFPSHLSTLRVAMTAKLSGRRIDHMDGSRSGLSGRVWICSTNPYLLRLMPSVVSDDSLIEIHPNPLPAAPCVADSIAIQTPPFYEFL